jgi:hypothetical protein
MSGIPTEGQSGFEENQKLRTLWRFSSILERILRCGWGQAESPDVDEGIFLSRLEMNFITPSVDPAKVLPVAIAPHYACGERLLNQELKDAYLNPHSLASTLANWVAVAMIHRDLEIEFMGNEFDLSELLGRITDDTQFYVDGEELESRPESSNS